MPAARFVKILETAHVASELDGIRFIRPELLLVCNLLRPRVEAKLAAAELVLSRRDRGLDLPYARRWAQHLELGDTFDCILELADRFAEI